MQELRYNKTIKVKLGSKHDYESAYEVANKKAKKLIEMYKQQGKDAFKMYACERSLSVEIIVTHN